MWPRFGIKLGNSTVCVASAKDDFKVEVIANKHGDRVSQAVLLCDSNEIEIGLTAKQKMSSKSQSTICNSFQLFPMDFIDNPNYNEIDEAIKHIPCKYNLETNYFELQSFDNDNPSRLMTPYEVTVELFKASFELARQCHLSDEHPAVVLSIPMYYPLECYEKLSNAAEQAGFNVVQVIPETTAACLAYELAENSNNKYVLCIKTGGLLTSFTLFNIDQGLYSVIDSIGPFYIGGKQLTDVLVDFISKEFYKKYRLDPHESRRSMAKIRTSAENCKHILTTLPSTQIYIDSLMDGVDFNVQMSRARYESLIQPVLNEFLIILNNSLEKINNDNKQIDDIILIGGTMKIPKIQSCISSRFPEAKLNYQYPSDEVVAIGCAKQTLYIHDLNEKKEFEKDFQCSSITSDIYVWHNNNVDNNCNTDTDEHNNQQQQNKELIIAKGTLLPTKIIINVEANNTTNDNNDNTNKFYIETNDKIDIIEIPEAKEINGSFRLQANIEEYNGWPKITLKPCL